MSLCQMSQLESFHHQYPFRRRIKECPLIFEKCIMTQLQLLQHYHGSFGNTNNGRNCFSQKHIFGFCHHQSTDMIIHLHDNPWINFEFTFPHFAKLSKYKCRIFIFHKSTIFKESFIKHCTFKFQQEENIVLGRNVFFLNFLLVCSSFNAVNFHEHSFVSTK